MITDADSYIDGVEDLGWAKTLIASAIIVEVLPPDEVWIKQHRVIIFDSDDRGCAQSIFHQYCVTIESWMEWSEKISSITGMYACSGQPVIFLKVKIIDDLLKGSV